MANTEDFITQVLNQDFANSAVTFKDIMGDNVQQSLEQEKVKMANQVFNGIDPEEKADEDQYELDFDDPDDEDEQEEDLDAAAEEALDAEDDEDSEPEEGEEESEEDESEQ